MKSYSSELFNRYIWLANTVYSAGRITFEEIAARWRKSYLNNDGADFPLRTFHEHRKAVEEIFDIDICCDRRDGFRYYIGNTGDIEAGNLRKWIIGTMSVSAALADSRPMHGRIILEDIPSGLNFLTLFIEAMKNGQAVEVAHRGFGKETGSVVHLEPYCMKLFRQRWYVLGRNAATDELRVYGLDRISSCRALGDRFRIPEDFDAETFFNDYFGVYVDPSVKLEKVRLRAEGLQADYLRSLPLHHSQREISSDAECAVFEYFIRPTVDFINEIVGKSEDLAVISPLWLRQEVERRVGKITDMQAKMKLLIPEI